MAFERLPALLESDTALLTRGRFVDVDCLLGSTELAFHVAIKGGHIVDIAPAPILMRVVRSAAAAMKRSGEP